MKYANNLGESFHFAPLENPGNNDGSVSDGTEQASGSAGQVSAAAGDDWRELARRVQGEKDPAIMIELVQQLIARLDATKPRQSSHDEE